MIAFDIGSYFGDTTKYLLKNYDNIVCVDANPSCIQILKNRYKDNDNIHIIFGCISKYVDGYSDFYLSHHFVWNSIYKEISERFEPSLSKLSVPNISIIKLIKEYGLPDYMKIDIEGADIFVLEQLENSIYRPKYISCESECIGNRPIKEGEDIKVLNKLKELGYNKFVLFNNNSLLINENIKYNDDFLDPLNIKEEYWITYNDIFSLIKNVDRTKYSTFTFWADIIATY